MFIKSNFCLQVVLELFKYGLKLQKTYQATAKNNFSNYSIKSIFKKEKRYH